MILIIDNYDSFTYNLVDYFNRLEVKNEVMRCDSEMSEIATKPFDGIVLSPGPQKPADAFNLLQIIKKYQNVPMLGICLGHQAILELFGGSLKKSKPPFHGRVSQIQHTGQGLFNAIENPMNVVRYHSWEADQINDSFEVHAQTKDGVNMAIKMKNKPIWGLQFHPESILTENGIEILKNWLYIYNLL